MENKQTNEQESKCIVNHAAVSMSSHLSVVKQNTSAYLPQKKERVFSFKIEVSAVVFV